MSTARRGGEVTKNCLATSAIGLDGDAEYSGAGHTRTATMVAPRAICCAPSSRHQAAGRSTARRDGWGGWRQARWVRSRRLRAICSRLRPVAVGACSVTFLSVSSVASM